MINERNDYRYKFLLSIFKPQKLSIVIYEYFGNGKVEKLHEEYIDSFVEYLSKTHELAIIWIDYNEMVANQLKKYLYEKGIGISGNSSAYNYIKESKFIKGLYLIGLKQVQINM